MIGSMKTHTAVAAGALLVLFGTSAARATCVGDCNNVGTVSIANVQACINIFLGAELSICTNCDQNLNHGVEINEVQGAVNSFLDASTCPMVTPPAGTPVPTNTPVPMATATNTTAPTQGATNTASPTNTKPPATATATRTRTPTVSAAICGDGKTTGDEECDDGGVCTGGTNAGTPCTAESQCTGNGICDFGPHIGAACANNADCIDPNARCIRCKPFGGDGCAANCTLERTITNNLVPGVTTQSSIVSGSGAFVHDGTLHLPLAISGQQIIVAGKPRNSDPIKRLPFVIKTSTLPKISVSILACACVRGLAGKTCGGTLFEEDAKTLSTDCTPNYAVGACTSGAKTCTKDSDCPDPRSGGPPVAGGPQGNFCVSGSCTCHLDSDCTGGTCVVHACDGKKPCSFVNGPGNGGAGILGCTAGLSGTNLSFIQDDGGLAHPPPPQPTPPIGSGPPIVELANLCSCSSNANCKAGQTCNTSTHQCEGCSVDTDCGTGGFCICPLFGGSANCFPPTVGAGTPTPTPGPKPYCVNLCATAADCPMSQTCQSGVAGSGVVLNTSAIGTITARCTNAMYATFCTDSDPQSLRGLAQTLPQVTGSATGEIFNVNQEETLQSNHKIGPYSGTGAPLNCSVLTAPTPGLTGFKIAGAFTSLNQPTTNSIVVTNLFISQ